MGRFKKAAEILEFSKILGMLKKFICCEDTENLVSNIYFSTNINVVQNMCSETDEALVICKRFNSPPFFNVKNVSEAYKRAVHGIDMNCGDILNVGVVLKQSRYLKNFYNSHEEYISYLEKYFNSLYVNLDVEKLIFKSIVSENEVSDDASDMLKAIRGSIKRQHIKIKNILEDFVKSDKKKYLQDNIITMRQGRHVVAVKAEFVKEVPGIVHDVSSSGATVFIEPSFVVAVDNELSVLITKEQNEIAKILKNLTDVCLEFTEYINKSYSNILKLDLIFAKSKFGISIDGVKPNLVDSGEICLKKVRHPLIDANVVVPIDIQLGGKYKNLIITGPNTGGKTVALKTVGLSVLMAMCGFLIPAAQGSIVSVFKDILVAIGDEQSIENSLSTFSAHMKNIVFILRVVNSKSLVLIDELASGTDPEQGAALAVSVVEDICKKKATLAATTHYSELKTFAFKNDLVKNASFEFNISNLEPTYKLLIGTAGGSYAFLISKKLGVSVRLIDRAKQFMSKKSIYFNDMLTKLEKFRKDYEKKFALLNKKNLELSKAKAELEKERESLNFNVKSAIDKAKKEATYIIDNVRSKANFILNELKDIKKDINKKDVSSLISATKSIVKKSVYGLYDDVDSLNGGVNGECERFNKNLNFDVGDKVLVKDLEQKGRVLKKADVNGKVLVEIGNIKTRVSEGSLQLIEKMSAKKVNINVKKVLLGKQKRDIKTEVDLRGYNVQEALLELDRFIDGCVLNNIGVVTIIHGKGTGTLKRAVLKHVKSHPNILSSRLGVYGEGEDGVTIVELK